MAFLLGLFVGTTIFILGFLLGGSIGLSYNSGNNVSDEKTNPKYVKCLLDDFGDLVDQAVDCYERDCPLEIEMEGLTVMFLDKQMHLDQCLNINNEG
jgi:hypothetical protein